MNYGTYIGENCVVSLDNVLTIVEADNKTDTWVRYMSELQVIVPVKFSDLLAHVKSRTATK